MTAVAFCAQVRGPSSKHWAFRAQAQAGAVAARGGGGGGALTLTPVVSAPMAMSDSHIRGSARFLSPEVCESAVEQSRVSINSMSHLSGALRHDYMTVLQGHAAPP